MRAWIVVPLVLCFALLSHAAVFDVNVRVTKTADAGSIDAGDAAGFTLTVTSIGVSAATGVLLTDPLPNGPSFSINGGTGAGSCGIVADTLTCNFGSMSAGSSLTVHVSAVSRPADCGNLSNTAVVQATNEDSGADGDNSSTATITVNCPDVTIAKSADASPINAGSTAAFTLVVSNGGDGTAHGVALTDPLPAGVSWVDDSSECDITAGVLSCNFGDLASTDSKTVHVSATTGAANCGTLTNTATVSVTNEATADTADNSSTASITVACPGLVLSKTADNGTVSAGDAVGFLITVSNPGAGTTADVTVTDTLPAGVSWSINGGANAGDCGIAADVLSCAFGDLVSGSSKTVHIGGLSDVADCGLLSNTALASSDGGTVEQSTASVAVNCASLDLSKTATNAIVDAGESITFTLTVTNDANGTARGVALTDLLPTASGLSWSTVNANSNVCGITAGVLSCNFGDIAGHGSKTVTVTSPTTSASCGTISNTASITSNNGEGANAVASVDVRCPNLVVTKTAAASPVNANGPIGFTIAVRNAGLGAAKSATLTDPLPAGFGWSEDSSDCAIAAGTLSCSFGDLAASATRTVHITGTVPPGACGTTVVNTATGAVSNESSADTQDNRATATVSIVCPEVGTIGFWRNWRNHYTAAQLALLLANARARTPEIYDEDGLTGTGDDLSAQKLDALFTFGSKPSVDQRLLAQLTALELDLAVTELDGTAGIKQKHADVCESGRIQLSGIPGGTTFFGTATPTIAQALGALAGHWTGALTGKKPVWRFNLTAAQKTMLLNALTGTNEGPLLIGGC